MKFKKDFLIDELGLPETAMEERIIDTSRWSNHYEIVFEYDGKFYKTWYSEGATEMQHESPWEYEDEVECEEVIRKQVMVEKWVEIE